MYQRLNTRYNNCNRTMMTVYAQFLIADLPLDEPVEGTALSVAAPKSVDQGPKCPYSHMRDHPAPPPAVPMFDPIVIEELPQHALLTRDLRTAAGRHTPNAVWAIADSGASHILIRAADAYILTHSEYTATNLPPLAVLKTANGAPLAVIGQGTLTMGSLGLTAYILLGLAPLADRNCTTIFKPASFHVYRNDGPQPILFGMRD